MGKNIAYENLAERLISKVGKLAGFSNDNSLITGKAGIAILLFHASRYFSSIEFEKLGESLICDIFEEDISSRISNQNSYGIFWGLHYLAKSKFIEIDEIVFDEIDAELNSRLKNGFPISPANYLFLGAYLSLKFKTLNYSDSWFQNIDLYIRNMNNIISNNNNIYLYNINLFDSFWYLMLKSMENGFAIEETAGSVNDTVLFFEKIVKTMPDVALKGPSFQFYSTLKKHDFKFDPLYISSISEVNSLFLNKLLYDDFIMPSNTYIEDALVSIMADKQTLQEIEGFINYQNSGISGYASGLVWSLLQYLQQAKQQ